MKFAPHFPKRILAVAGLAVFSTSPAWAVFPFSWATDPFGVISGGDWTGNGALQPNLNPASTTAQIAVQNFTSGALLIDNMGGSVYSSGRLLTDPISATHSISLTGGTADLRFHNSNSFDGGGSLFNSVGLTDFQGVTGISWTIRFSEPIAGRNSEFARRDIMPVGAALALITAGTGQSISSFTVDMEYTQIYHEVGGEFVAGAPAGARPIVNTGFGPQATQPLGGTSFTSDSFNAINEFLLVRGYDAAGGTTYDATDAPLVYMREMTWTIRRDDNQAFASNTLFTMSMDGQQFSNVSEVIPEPTSVMLMAGSVLGGCLLRRRRA